MALGRSGSGLCRPLRTTGAALKGCNAGSVCGDSDLENPMPPQSIASWFCGKQGVGKDMLGGITNAALCPCADCDVSDRMCKHRPFRCWFRDVS